MTINLGTFASRCGHFMAQPRLHASRFPNKLQSCDVIYLTRVNLHVIRTHLAMQFVSLFFRSPIDATDK